MNNRESIQAERSLSLVRAMAEACAGYMAIRTKSLFDNDDSCIGYFGHPFAKIIVF